MQSALVLEISRSAHFSRTLLKLFFSTVWVLSISLRNTHTRTQRLAFFKKNFQKKKKTLPDIKPSTHAHTASNMRKGRRPAPTLPPRVQFSTLPQQDIAAPSRPRAAFVGGSIEEYSKRYWCVKFTEVQRAHENREMQRFCQWYAVRCRVVYLEHLPPGIGVRLRTEIGQRMGLIGDGDAAGITLDLLRSVPLPVLFVNGKLVGDLRAMYVLEESARLKDVLQFGMMWHARPDAGPDVHPQALPVPPSIYGDEEMFRGTYRGSPTTAPVQELPRHLPRGSIVEGPGSDGF